MPVTGSVKRLADPSEKGRRLAAARNDLESATFRLKRASDALLHAIEQREKALDAFNEAVERLDAIDGAEWD